MPEMGESVTEGTVLEWHKQEGEAVAEGDTVVEVSTDKVDAEVPAPASGTITKILAQPDETSRSARCWPSIDARRRCAHAPTARRRRRGAVAAPAAAGGRRRDGTRASPVARRVAAAERSRPERRRGLGRRAAR